MTMAQVQGLNVDSVYNDIVVFLNKYKKEKTKVAYLKYIEDYFMFICGKKLNELTRENVEYVMTSNGKERLLNKHIERYKQFLQKKNTDNSVISKLYSVRSLFKFLQINGYDVDHMIFDIKSLEKSVNSYDTLSVEQTLAIAEAAKTHRLGDELHPFILLSAQTSIRVTALLSLKWNEIYYDKDEDVYVTDDIIDKRGQKRECPFDKSIYEKLVQVKKDKNKVFTMLTVDNVNRAIKKLATQVGVPSHLRIVTHSLRKVAPTFEMNETGSIEKAQQQTGIKTAQVLLESYTKNKYKLRERAGMRMMKQVNEEVLELVSKEEILDLLREFNPAAYRGLVMKVQEIVGV